MQPKMGQLSLLIIFALSFASQGFSASAWSRLTRHPTALPRTLPRELPVVPLVCENFSGVWLGSCDGESEQFSMKIEQMSCGQLVIDGASYTFGTAKTTNLNSGRHQSAEFTNFDWVDDVKAIYMSWHIIDKEFGSPGTTQGRVTARLMKSDSDTIVMKMASEWFTDSSDTPWSNVDEAKCVYQRWIP